MTDFKKVLKVVHANAQHWVGDGLPVHTAIDYHELGVRLNPFILLDYGAPHHFSPSTKPRGVGFHPHRGFQTVTVAFQGEITHTDTTGNSGTIHAGDVQWMTAGRGIEHSEMHSDRFTREGGTLEMLQLWVNLPAKYKMSTPGYQAITSNEIPSVGFDGGKVNVIAGDYHGTKGPASTFTPMNLFSVTLEKDSKATFSASEGWVGAIMVRSGDAVVNGHRAGAKDLVALEKGGSEIQITSTNGSEFVLMAGHPINEPISAHGPMVMNTREEIMQAFKDYKEGKFRA